MFLTAKMSRVAAVVEWLSSGLAEQGVQGTNPGLATLISELGFLLLPSRDIKSPKQPNSNLKFLDFPYLCPGHCTLYFDYLFVRRNPFSQVYKRKILKIKCSRLTLHTHGVSLLLVNCRLPTPLSYHERFDKKKKEKKENDFVVGQFPWCLIVLALLVYAVLHVNVSLSNRFLHLADITCSLGCGTRKEIKVLENLPYIDFIATGVVRVSQTHLVLLDKSGQTSAKIYCTGFAKRCAQKPTKYRAQTITSD